MRLENRALILLEIRPDQVIGLLDVFTAEIALDRLRDL